MIGPPGARGVLVGHRHLEPRPARHPQGVPRNATRQLRRSRPPDSIGTTSTRGLTRLGVATLCAATPTLTAAPTCRNLPHSFRVSLDQRGRRPGSGLRRAGRRRLALGLHRSQIRRARRLAYRRRRSRGQAHPRQTLHHPGRRQAHRRQSKDRGRPAVHPRPRARDADSLPEDRRRVSRPGRDHLTQRVPSRPRETGSGPPGGAV
jgi:hypothetical protein